MKVYALLFLMIFSFSFCKNSNSKKAKTTTVSTKPTAEETVDLTAPTDAFIKKYKGTIGENQTIELVLVNWSNGILGGYYFSKKGNQESQKIELSGELQLNETFIIDEYTNDDFSGKFVGSLSNLKQLSGQWSNADSSQTLPYQLTEILHQDSTGWSGSWYRNKAHNSGTLILGNVTDKTVDFALEVFNGGHSGLLEGTATLNGGIAVFKNSVFDEEENCFIIFQKDKNQIRIVQKSSPWACGFGMRAHADGKYDDHLQPEKLELAYGTDNSIFTTKEQRDNFAKMVDTYYEDFAFNMQNIAPIQQSDADDFEAKVFVGNVTGLATTNEAIIMHNTEGLFWAALIVYDQMEENFQVQYFTNDEKRRTALPPTIEEWRKEFSDYEVLL